MLQCWTSSAELGRKEISQVQRFVRPSLRWEWSPDNDGSSRRWIWWWWWGGHTGFLCPSSQGGCNEYIFLVFFAFFFKLCLAVIVGFSRICGQTSLLGYRLWPPSLITVLTHVTEVSKSYRRVKILLVSAVQHKPNSVIKGIYWLVRESSKMCRLQAQTKQSLRLTRHGPLPLPALFLSSLLLSG